LNFGARLGFACGNQTQKGYEDEINVALVLIHCGLYKL